MNTITKSRRSRYNTAIELTHEFQIDYGDNFSSAIYGSTVIGSPGLDSDIDMFFVIPEHKFRSALQCSIIKDVFKTKLNEVVISKFCTGEFDVYRPEDGVYKDIVISLYIFSETSCIRMANLEEFFIQKYRFSARDNQLLYRGFGYAEGQPTLPFELLMNEELGGVRTQCKSIARYMGELYIHTNIEKFFTADFIYDNLKMKEWQNNLRINIHKEFLKTTHHDEFGFLYKRNLIDPDQLSKLKFKENR